MMIKNISIRGYRCIKELENFELKPLNVLIGPNKSGKSNFLDFFAFLKDIVESGLIPSITKRGGLGSMIWAGGNIDRISADLLCAKTGRSLFPKFDSSIYSFSVKPVFFGDASITERINNQDVRQSDPADFFEADIDTEAVQRELVVSKKYPQKKRHHHPELSAISWIFDDIHHYGNFDTTMESELRKPKILEPSRTILGIWLNETGDNLINVYYQLFNPNTSSQLKDDILSTLKRAFPGFKDLLFPIDDLQRKVQLGWQDESLNRKIYASELSDGTLKFLCLLSILLTPQPFSPIVCIDEPEVSLHPELIKIIAELMIEASERMQLIVATHSPMLVSALRPQDIVIVEPEDGAATFKRLNPDELTTWLKDFSLGELWQMGEIGGRK